MVLLAVNLTTTALTGRQLDGHWQMQVGISELPHTARLTLWTDFSDATTETLRIFRHECWCYFPKARHSELATLRYRKIGSTEWPEWVGSMMNDATKQVSNRLGNEPVA